MERLICNMEKRIWIILGRGRDAAVWTLCRSVNVRRTNTNLKQIRCKISRSDFTCYEHFRGEKKK